MHISFCKDVRYVRDFALAHWFGRKVLKASINHKIMKGLIFLKKSPKSQVRTKVKPLKWFVRPLPLLFSVSHLCKAQLLSHILQLLSAAQSLFWILAVLVYRILSTYNMLLSVIIYRYPLYQQMNLLNAALSMFDYEFTKMYFEKIQ